MVVVVADLLREKNTVGWLVAGTGLKQSVIDKVNLTGGNRSGLTGYRSNRSGPVPVWAGTKPAQNSKFKFKFKKLKNSQKIPKNTSRCDESNGVKFSQKFIHLV